MPFNRTFYHSISLSCLLAITPAIAQTETEHKTQSVNTLYELVLNHLKQKTDQKLYNTQINIKKISSRLNLPQCQLPIELADRMPERYYGRLSIKLECTQPFWKLYVSAEIQGDLPVVKTTQGILKQAVIKTEDVSQELIPYQKVKRNAFIDPKRVIGMRAKRAIGPNNVLTVNMLQPPFVVFKGKLVSIVTRIGSIKVESRGIALENGTLQQQIKVKNSSSDKVIRALVIGNNKVEVP